ncbi:insulinoma-associated protein 1b [Anopheles bellator]|uniref:insulinoma-associated protein 1b n=1 Tax=Anopheles bellator TaxID=139047 RepID=UPI0026484C18|nr:insulinoma-associated protein 1b [Anopheles bellator]
MATIAPPPPPPQARVLAPTVVHGLLTTVANLPPPYKLQYPVVADAPTPVKAPGPVDSPLDLTVRPTAPLGPITPPATPSPLKKRYREDNLLNFVRSDEPQPKRAKDEPASEPDVEPQVKQDPKTPPAKASTKAGSVPPRSTKNPPPAAASTGTSKERRAKAIRKLKFDEENSSPVSGTIIISLEEAMSGDAPRESGDIDPQFNLVEVSDEVRAELAAIANVIGAYNCKLCRLEFEDAFGLAQHRCSCIVLLEYRCPECGKRFNCPANLASHRRWHKPRDQTGAKKGGAGPSAAAAASPVERNEGHQSDSDGGASKFRCKLCDKTFKRAAYLKKHQQTHNKAPNKTSSKGSKGSRGAASSAPAVTPYRSEDSNHSSQSVRSGDGSHVDTASSDVVMAEDPVRDSDGPPPLTVFRIVDGAASASENHYPGEPTVTFIQQPRASSVVSSSGRGSVAPDHEDDPDDSDCEERTLVINEDYRGDEPDDEDEMERQYRSAYCDRFTEEENLAAAALARLRNGPSVIRHTTALVV